MRRLVLFAVFTACVATATMGYRHAVTPSGKPPAAATLDAPTLPEEDRHYLWEVEHFGNVLGKHGFGPLAKLLVTANDAGLERLLAADFAATDLDAPREERLRSTVVDVLRHTDAGRPPRSLDRRQFLERLLTLRRIFHKQPSAKLAMMTLAPADRANPDGPWQGKCQLRIWGEAAPGKPAEVLLYARYRIRKPTEKLLAEPGWLQHWEFLQEQVGRAERPLFREVAAARGLQPGRLHDNWTGPESSITTTGGVYVCDFNRDGYLDLLIPDLHDLYLYAGRAGGRFEDVTVAVGLAGALLAEDARGVMPAAILDIDGDGWDDLVLAGAVYRNEAGKRFVDVTARTNLRVPAEATGVAIADFDRDGRLDLYVFFAGAGKADSWLTGRSGVRHGNRLLRNRGDWRFEDVTTASGTDGGARSTFAAVWLDADNDGWPDLFVPNEFGNGLLYVNRGDGTFREQELTDYPCDFGTMGVTVGDIDDDGQIDLYLGNMYSKAGTRVMGNMRPDSYPPDVMTKMRTFVRGSQLHRNLGGLRFEQKAQDWQVADAGWAYGPALADFDNDGSLDIHATAGFISRSRGEPDG